MKPLASISLDLDNEWAYLKARDDPAWRDYPSYLNRVVPRVLEVLRSRQLRITFFVVGQDALLEKNRPALRAIAVDGHEIASHSMRHEPWLHRYSKEELGRELAQAEDAIEAATGARPRGFRGPGFSLTPAVLQVLAERGYDYDASTFPSFLGPIARAYFLATGKFSAEQRARLDELFGRWSDGFQSLRPYRWKVGTAGLLEVPVTTFPGIKVPIHLSYVHYLARFSQRLAAAYFGAALVSARLFRVEPSILLHPLDFLGADEVPSLAYFPAMNIPSRSKTALVEDCLDMIVRRFNPVTVAEHARIAGARTAIPSRVPAT